MPRPTIERTADRLRAVPALRKPVNLAVKVATRRPDLVLHNPPKSYHAALRDPTTLPAAVEDSLPAGVAVHHDVVSWPISWGDVLDYRGGLLDRATGGLLADAVHYTGPTTFVPENHYSQEPPPFDWRGKVGSGLPRVQAPVLYGGILYDQFSHFLLESLARLWAYDSVRALDPYVLFYAPMGVPRYLDRRHYMQEIFGGLGIPIKRILLVEEPALLETVLVPEQRYGYELCRSADTTFVDFVRTYRYERTVPPALAGAERVYVSRSQMTGSARNGYGRPMAEPLFERYLESQGYRVFHPQRHSVAEQLSVYSQARKLVFCDGGAIHGCVLLPDLAADVAVVARRRDARWDGRDIVDQFYGYGQKALWVDEVERQYEFGMESWNARSLLDWYGVSTRLLDAEFVEEPWHAWRSVDREALVRSELHDFVRSIAGEPMFVDYLAGFPEDLGTT